MLYRHQAFGLVFRSERQFDELTPVLEENNDSVLIAWGETPTNLQQPYLCHGLVQARPGELLLSIPEVAQYYITREAIVITPHRDAGDSTVRLFLFGSAMGALLHLHGILALHGSVVRLPSGGAAAFCGMATAGKSTLAAALSQRGCAVLADDIVAVRFDEQGQPWSYPGLARSKLWEDAFQKLALPQGPPVRDGIAKYFHPLETAATPEPLRRIYEIHIENRQGIPTLRGLSGMETMPVFLRNTFRPRFIQLIGAWPEHLRRVATLAGKTLVSDLRRPLNGNTLPQLTEMLARDWE